MEQAYDFSLKQLLADELPEIDDIQLLDVIPLEHLQFLQDKFSHANGVTSVMLDLDGNPITNISNLNELCTLSFYAGKKCIKYDRMVNNVEVERTVCGLSEASTPLHVGGKHVANWNISMCGFGGIITPFMEAACDNIEKYNEIYGKLQPSIKIYFDRVCDLLKTAAEEITEQIFTNLKQSYKLALLKKKDIQLAENEEAFRNIFDNSIDGIILIGNEGIVKEWSVGAEKVTGISKAKAEGQKIWELVHMCLPTYRYDEEKRKEMCEKVKKTVLNKENVTLIRNIINLETREEIVAKTIYFPLSAHGEALMGCISRNITKEVANERELHVEKERIKSLSDNLPGGALYQFVLNPKNQKIIITYVSAQWEAITGVPSSVAMADIDNVFSAVHPEDIASLDNIMRESARNMTKFNCEIRFVVDNETRWTLMKSHVHREEELVVWDGIILDISERKQNELQLKDYRENLEHQVKLRTEQFEATNQELYATNEELYTTNEELHNKNEQLHEEMITRRELMQKLEESESKMRTFIEQSFEGIIILDNEGLVIEWNAAQEAITGLMRNEAIGRYSWEIFKSLAADDEMVKSYRKQVFAFLSSEDEENNSIEAEYVIELSDFDIRYITIASFRMAMGDKVFVGEIVRDTTERKLADIELETYRTQLEEMVENQTKKLIESKERLTSLSNNLPGGVIFQMSDKNTLVPQFTYISAHFEEMFHTSIETVVDDTSMFLRLFDPEDGAKLIDLLTSADQSKLVDVECRINLESGETRWIHLRWSYHNLKDGTHLWDGFIIDITDKKIAELELDETRYRQNILINVLQLVQSSDDLQKTINQVLAEAGKYAGVSRSYIFEKTPDGKAVNNIYEWCNDNIEPEIDNLQEVPIENTRSWFCAFEKNKFICTSDISTLEPEVYQALSQQGIKSILVLPLTANGITYGFIGFDECTHNKEWRKNDIELLISLSQIISAATSRYLAEKAIKLSQQTMHTVLDNINASIYVADYVSYELLFANKTLKDLMGCDPVGELCYAVLQGKSEPCEFCPKPNLLDANKKSIGTYRWERFNPALGKWFECSDTAIEWVDGRMVHMEYATDITDRREAEEAVRRSEEMYRQLTAASPDAIAVCSPTGNIIYLSSRAKELFLIQDDFEFDEIPFTRYVHPHDMRKATEMLKSLAGNVVAVQPQLLLMRDDGSEFFGELSSASVKDDKDKTTSIIMVIRDITERKISEMELIRAKEKAEESDKLKSAFLANMSHEIRTPINGINGFLSFIADENLSQKRRNEYITIVHNSSAQLVRIIDDIIDIAKIEAQQLTIRPMTFHLNEFMKELHTFFETFLRANKKDKIALVLDDSQFIEDCNILSDPTRLRQVITNLIGNAAKFTEKGYINFGYRLMPPDKLEFWIEDTGIGMPADQLEVIFERFRQVELSNHRKYGGTGLGLTISRSLVQMMGGTIDVESIENEGSTFKFNIAYLPIDRTDEPVFAEIRAEKPIEDQYFPGASILVVEPEVIVTKYYEKILTYNGAAPIFAQNVAQWIEMMNQEKHIDMVLVDARVFQTEDTTIFNDVKSVRAGLQMMMIAPEINEHYSRIINNMQCSKILEGRPDYKTLCEELLRLI